MDWAKTTARRDKKQCMKRPVAHSLNSTWFWIELPENCCEPLKFIMKYISIQFCEWPGHGRPFHALHETFKVWDLVPLILEIWRYLGNVVSALLTVCCSFPSAVNKDLEERHSTSEQDWENKQENWYLELQKLRDQLVDETQQNHRLTDQVGSNKQPVLGWN